MGGEGRPAGGGPGRLRGAGDRRNGGGIDGRRRLTGQSPTATAEPIDKGCTADARAPARHGAGGAPLPRGVGGDLHRRVDREVKRTGGRARSAKAEPGLDGAGPEGCRAARPAPAPGGRTDTRLQAKCVMRKRGKERGASCPKKILRRGRSAKHPPSEQGRGTGSRPTPKERRSGASSPTRRAGRRPPPGD